jgi:CBS domain containing-hemolysin-like protein
MKTWIEKNQFWIHWAIKLSYPVMIFLGLAVGNYLIGYFGVETQVHASQLYVTKSHIDSCLTSQSKFNDHTAALLERLDRVDKTITERQKIDREHVVILNNKHNIPTRDYPIP